MLKNGADGEMQAKKLKEGALILEPKRRRENLLAVYVKTQHLFR